MDGIGAEIASLTKCFTLCGISLSVYCVENESKGMFSSESVE